VNDIGICTVRAEPKMEKSEKKTLIRDKDDKRGRSHMRKHDKKYRRICRICHSGVVLTLDRQSAVE
jgi:hypothetical protein